MVTASMQSVRSPVTVAACVLALAVAACSTQQPTAGSPTLAGAPRLRVAQAAEEAGDFGFAEQMYAAASQASPADTAVQLRYADVLVRNGKLAEAKQVLADHLTLVGDPAQLRAGLGSVYVLSGEPDRALAEFDAVLRV